MPGNRRVEGYCSCPDAPNCIHCLVFAEHLAPAAETRAKFQRGFGKMGDAVARQRLTTRVRPFLLRRTKTHIARDPSLSQRVPPFCGSFLLHRYV